MVNAMTKSKGKDAILKKIAKATKEIDNSKGNFKGV
jgi:hypothetical protein